jgi:hypothetical protein
MMPKSKITRVSIALLVALLVGSAYLAAQRNTPAA